MIKAIGNVPARVDPELATFLNSVKEVVESGAGWRNRDPLQRYVKIDDLVKMNLARVLTVGKNGILNPGQNLVGGDAPNMAVPPRPTGFDVTDGFDHVFLDWDIPSTLYANHSYTEIWRSDQDNLSAAVLIGQNPSFAFADMAVAQEIQYYYWIRFVSTAGVKGPFNSTDGTPGARSLDPAELLKLLEGQITRSYLHGELITEIDDLTGRIDALTLIYGDTLTAAQSAAAAAQSEANAIAAETAALIAQGEAEAAQVGAETALQAATEKATASANSASEASAYKTDAETAAAASQSSRLASEVARDESEVFAQSSSESASVSTSKANDAGDFASAAQTSATSAATSEGNASTSAGQASQSATTAAGHASSAYNYSQIIAQLAIDAENSATAAAGHASSAESHSDNAETWAGAANTAKVEAEAARDASEGFAGAASTTAAQVDAKVTEASGYASSANSSAQSASTSAGQSYTYSQQSADSAYQAGQAAEASSIDYSAVQSRLNNFNSSSTSVEQTMSAIANSVNGLTAQWTVKTQVGSLVGGVGFYNNGSTTQFLVHADTFAVYSPGSSSLTFAIDNGRVVMSGAYIEDGTITDAKIYSLAVNKITGLTANFITANVQSLHADKITGDVGKVLSGITNYSNLSMPQGQYVMSSSCFITAQPYPRKPVYFYSADLIASGSGEFSVDVCAIRNSDYFSDITTYLTPTGSNGFSWGDGSRQTWVSEYWSGSRPSAITSYINNFAVGNWVRIGQYVGQVTSVGDSSVAPNVYNTRISFGTRFYDSSLTSSTTYTYKFAQTPYIITDLGTKYFYTPSSGTKSITGSLPENYAFSDARTLKLAFRANAGALTHDLSRFIVVLLK